MSKKIRFAGSSVGEPWWVAGDITRRLLEPLGYEVEVLADSGSTKNPRYVGGGKAELGASVVPTIRWAVRGEHLYEGETFAPMRAIARLVRPAWLGIAVRWELGLRTLQEVAQSGYPLRLETHALDTIAAVLPLEVLRHYHLTPEDIEERGGSTRVIGRGDYRAGDADLIIGNLYMGRTAVTKSWFTATEHQNMRFLELDDDILAQLAENGHGKPGQIPFHFLRGVDRPVKALEQAIDLLIYCPADLDEDFVHDLTKLYDTNRDLFFQQSFHMAYDPARAVDTGPLEMHPGAERHYREVGLL